MNVFRGWVLAPVVLTLVVLGLGLLVERLGRRAIAAPLLPGVGLATAIVTAGLLTIRGATARWATPVCVALAITGFVVTRRQRTRRPTRRGLATWGAVGVLAFAVYAAPVLSSGQPTLAGYVKLDDSANWLALTDHVMDHGRAVGHHEPSTYALVLGGWLGTGYPVGSFVPLGIASRSTGSDPADAYQSTIAVYAAIAALAMAACAWSAVKTRRRSAIAGLVAVQASLLFGYAQWGGIKEVATVALIATLGGLAGAAWSGRARGAPTATCFGAGALLGVLGVNGAVWAVPALAMTIAGVLDVARREHRLEYTLTPRRVGAGALLAVMLVAGAAPALASIKFAKQTTGVLSASDELGNLARPLETLQGAGVWPVGDFRDVPRQHALLRVVAVLVAAAAAAAVAMAIVDRDMALVSYVLITLVGAVPALIIGSPWVDAKVLATTAPAVLLGAVVLAIANGRAPTVTTRSVGAVGTAALVVAVGWSTVAATRGTWAAPRDGFDDLEALSSRLRGAGPTLVLDHDTFADRYFLRDAQAEGATDLRAREVHRDDGGTFPSFSTVEVDDVATADLFTYRTLVRRRSPSASRPPDAYRLVFRGRVWEAWQRGVRDLPPRAHLPLGSSIDPSGELSCPRVAALATSVAARDITAMPATAPVVVALGPAQAPTAWRNGDDVAPRSSATMVLTVDVPAAATYRAWVGGAIVGRLEVVVDGHHVGTRRHELAHGAPWQSFGTVALDAGRHVVELRYRRGLVAAGSGSPAPPLGPLAFQRADASIATTPPIHLPVARAAELCDGTRYDWVDLR